MTYFDFLFSQLFMKKLEEYDYIMEYDEVYNEINYFIMEYNRSTYSLQHKSEYDCINDFLTVELIPYIMKKYSDE